MAVYTSLSQVLSLTWKMRVLIILGVASTMELSCPVLTHSPPYSVCAIIGAFEERFNRNKEEGCNPH